MQRILNNSYHSSIGTTPARILFGDTINLNRGLLVSKSNSTSQEVVLEDYVQQLNIQLQNIVAASQRHQNDVIKRRLQASPDNPTTFEEGQFVLAKYPTGPPSKTTPRWRGPFIIVEVANQIYYCQDLITQRIIPMFIDQLKLFVMDDKQDIEYCTQVALRDRDEFFVEKLIDFRHKGRIRARRQLEFRVRWLGYGPEDDTWLPYAEVRDLEALTTFIQDHPELSFLNK